jgi:hypothetical protein
MGTNPNNYSLGTLTSHNIQEKIKGKEIILIDVINLFFI